MAEKAGVSVATISRAMNSETRNKVAPETLKEIDKLVAQYGYTPHQAAKNLRKTTLKNIGVIFPYVENIFYSSYYTNILSGVANYILGTDYQFKMLLLKGDREHWDRYNFRAGEGVDGLIITQWFRFFSNKKVFDDMNIPSVVINDLEAGVKTRFICCNNFQGGGAAAEYLYTKGHKNISVVTGPAWSRDSQQRVEGFQAYMRRVNHPLMPDAIQRGDYDDAKVTQKALAALLKSGPDTTAIFCCNDNMAFMVIDELRRKNIPCPDRISVIGFDDDFRAAHFIPPLTTIQMPVYQMAQEATRILINHLESGNPAESFIGQTFFNAQIIERQTVITL